MIPNITQRLLQVWPLLTPSSSDRQEAAESHEPAAQEAAAAANGFGVQGNTIKCKCLLIHANSIFVSLLGAVRTDFRLEQKGHMDAVKGGDSEGQKVWR